MRLAGVYWSLVGLVIACGGQTGSKTDDNAAGHRDEGVAGQAIGGDNSQASSGGGGGSGEPDGRAGASEPASGDGGAAGDLEAGNGGETSGGTGGQAFAGSSPIIIGGWIDEPAAPLTGQLLDVLLDPGFQGTPANAWSLAEGATLAPAQVTGGVDPGQVRVDFCTNTRARVGQEFDAPSYAVAGPSAIIAHWRQGQGSSHLNVEIDGHGVPVRDGGLSDDGGGSSAWTTQHACLGEGAFGTGVQLQFGFSQASTCWPENYALIDRVDLVSDYSGCPAPGTVLNGDFEARGGWSEVSGVVAQTAHAGIVEGVGPAGTRAARIVSENPEWIELDGLLSVPLSSSMPNPMLRMTVKGSVGSLLNVNAGVAQAVITGTGAFEPLSLCLFGPDAGTVANLSFLLLEPGDFVVDDLALESNTQCAGVHIADGGFEQSALISPWVTGVGADGQPGASIHIESGVAAHSGSHYLHASSSSECGWLNMTAVISSPDPAPDAGPALHFFYRRPQAEAHVDYLVESDFFPSTPLPTAEVWTEKIVCLAPSKPGTSGTITFRQYNGGGQCGDLFPVEELFVDDVSVTTDPSCPTQ